jgi:uncharacterized protein YecE (DUF72 family)
MIHVGTCGYSYADWKGPFYPADLRPAGMLDFYARSFTAVEIDATYYRVPSAATFASMAARAPRGFRFSVKLPGTATHVPETEQRTVHPDVALLRRNVEPLVAAGSLAAALMQFPNSFHPTDAARAHIEALAEALPDIPLVAEFRHREWQTNATLEFLRDLDIGWVNVDMPQFDSLLRPSTDTTAPTAYVRFHGRNYKTWWKGTNVTRYDYDYTADELGPWADRLIEIATNPDVREVFAFFNNHRRGNAARNAEMLEDLLRARYPAAVASAPAPPPRAEQLTLGVENADRRLQPTQGED